MQCPWSKVLHFIYQVSLLFVEWNFVEESERIPLGIYFYFIHIYEDYAVFIQIIKN